MMLPGTSAVWHSIIKGYKFHCIVSTRLWLRCDYLRCKYSLKGERRIKGKSRGKTGDERKEKRVEHFGGFCGIQTKEVWASPTACPTQSIWTPCSTFPATPSYSLSSFITHLLPSFLSPSISCRIKTLLICCYRTTRPLTPNHQMQRALTHVLFLPFFFFCSNRDMYAWSDKTFEDISKETLAAGCTQGTLQMKFYSKDWRLDIRQPGLHQMRRGSVGWGLGKTKVSYSQLWCKVNERDANGDGA